MVNTTYYASGYLSFYDSLYTYYFVVSKSTDAGASWRRDTLTTSSSYMYCQALAVHPANHNLVYAGSYNGLFYKSTDAGNTWNLSNTGLGSAYYIYDIAPNPVNTNILYIGTSNAVYKSTNGGTNWSSIGLSGVIDLLVHPLGPDTVYAGTSTGFYKSTNAGGSWTAINGGLTDLNISALAIKYNGARADSTFLIAGTKGGGMHRMFLSLVPVEESKQNQAKANLIITPNPVHDNALFRLTLVQPARINISVYDIQGRVISEVVNGRKAAGVHEIIWDNASCPAGVYFVKASTDDNSEIRKLIVVR